MPTSHPEAESNETDNSLSWNNVKKWSLAAATSKPGRWTLSIASSAGAGLFVDKIFEAMLPASLGFRIFTYVSSIATTVGLARLFSHQITGQEEQAQNIARLMMEVAKVNLRADISELEIKELKAAPKNSAEGKPVNLEPNPAIAAKKKELEALDAKLTQKGISSQGISRRLSMKTEGQETQELKASQTTSYPSTEASTPRATEMMRVEVENVDGLFADEFKANGIQSPSDFLNFPRGDGNPLQASGRFFNSHSGYGSLSGTGAEEQEDYADRPTV